MRQVPIEFKQYKQKASMVQSKTLASAIQVDINRSFTTFTEITG